MKRHCGGLLKSILKNNGEGKGNIHPNKRIDKYITYG